MNRCLMRSQRLSAELTTSSPDSMMSLPILLPLWLLFLCLLCKLILNSLDSAKSPAIYFHGTTYPFRALSSALSHLFVQSFE